MSASRSGLLSDGCLYSPLRYCYHNNTGRRTEGLRGSQAICQAAKGGGGWLNAPPLLLTEVDNGQGDVLSGCYFVRR